MISAQFCPLRTEGQLFAAKLDSAGKLMAERTYAGVMHDFTLWPKHQVTRITLGLEDASSRSIITL